MAAVAYFTPDLFFILRDKDVDEARFGRGDAVFKGVLNKGDEDQRGDLRLAVRLYVELRNDLYVSREADTH